MKRYLPEQGCGKCIHGCNNTPDGNRPKICDQCYIKNSRWFPKDIDAYFEVLKKEYHGDPSS